MKNMLKAITALALGLFAVCLMVVGDKLPAYTVATPLAPNLGGTGFSSYTIGDLLYANGIGSLAKLADVAAGSYLRSGGLATAPLWSTLTLPNSATKGDIFFASAANTMGALADVAAGSVLRSGGVGADPAWSTATFPGTATTTGAYLRADGTNWIMSTLVLPNSATRGDIFFASAANTMGAIADVAAGSVLQSGGIGSDPAYSTATYPATAAGTGTLLRANGTNWVASTSTFADTYAAGDVLYASAANTVAGLADVAAGSVLRSGGVATAPAWSTATYPGTAAGTGTILRADGTNWAATTATYPATTTANQILYSSAASVIGEITTGNSGVLVTNGSGVPSIGTDIPTAVTIGSAYIYRAAGTDVPVTDGGTGASDAGTARTNLGLAIGSDVEAYNASLAAIAGGTWTGAGSITTVGTLTMSPLPIAASTAIQTGGANDGYNGGLRLTPTWVGDGIIATVAVNAGGLDYKVNDVLTVAGGTSGTVTVSTLDGDQHVDTITIQTPGTGYTVSVQNCTGGHGTGFVADITAVDGGDGHLDTVGISVAGSYYHVNDVLDVAGGTDGQVKVTAVDGTGAVTGVTVTTGGTGYEVSAAHATTGGSGTGCTIDISTLTARTISRHNYIDINDVTVSHGAAVTDGAVFRFNAAVGTHTALASPGAVSVTLGTGPTGANAGDPLGWIKINVNGTIRYIPFW